MNELKNEKPIGESIRELYGFLILLRTYIFSCEYSESEETGVNKTFYFNIRNDYRIINMKIDQNSNLEIFVSNIIYGNSKINIYSPKVDNHLYIMELYGLIIEYNSNDRSISFLNKNEIDVNGENKELLIRFFDDWVKFSNEYRELSSVTYKIQEILTDNKYRSVINPFTENNFRISDTYSLDAIYTDKNNREVLLVTNYLQENKYKLKLSLNNIEYTIEFTLNEYNQIIVLSYIVNNSYIDSPILNFLLKSNCILGQCIRNIFRDDDNQNITY